jgi:hypothetical protein
MNAAQILEMLLALLTQGVQLVQVVKQAQASGTDVTQAQLQELSDAYAKAKADLDAAIASVDPPAAAPKS